MVIHPTIAAIYFFPRSDGVTYDILDVSQNERMAEMQSHFHCGAWPRRSPIEMPFPQVICQGPASTLLFQTTLLSPQPRRFTSAMPCDQSHSFDTQAKAI